MNHPILSESIDVACGVVASASLMLTGSAAVVVSSPGSADLSSCFGAAVAGALVFAEARKKDRDILNLSITVIVSIGFGVIGPGVAATVAIAQGWLEESAWNHITWHSWAFAGLLFSLVGWSLSLSTYSLIANKLPAWLARRAEFLDK